MHPKGKIIVIGHEIITGNDEEKTISQREQTNNFFEFLLNRKDDRIELISAFSEDSEDVSEIYSAGLCRKGYQNFGIIHSKKIGNHENDCYLRIFKAKTIILTGNQCEIFNFFKHSSVVEMIHKKFIEDETFTIVGINNAAAVLSDLMTGNKDAETGLGFIKGCVISTPSDHRTGLKKLVKTVLSHQDHIGLSVCGMSVIIEKGYRVLCKGSGSVMSVNAKEVSAKSIKPFKRGVSVYVKNLKGHILVDSCAIDLRTGNRIKPQVFDYNLNFTSRNNIS